MTSDAFVPHACLFFVHTYAAKTVRISPHHTTSKHKDEMISYTYIATTTVHHHHHHTRDAEYKRSIVARRVIGSAPFLRSQERPRRGEAGPHTHTHIYIYGRREDVHERNQDDNSHEHTHLERNNTQKDIWKKKREREEYEEGVRYGLMSMRARCVRSGRHEG